ncbi:MAG: PAS domain-containing sensor histidine kinase [Rhodocyclales bacterium]|nr:PAS domain-containing sensor histidine kinase [Rhodocyclales bacterium]
MNAPETPSDPVAPAESERLAEAFRIFNLASEELAGTYKTLQAQVAQLTAELAAANGALRQQYMEKAALTERLTLLLDALPAGVVVFDAAGKVVEANPAAHVFGFIAGCSWADVEKERLVPAGLPGEYQAGERRVAVTVTPLDSSGGRIVLLHDVTEAHRLKTQVERNERLAAMGELAAQLAHQLRTPLAAALLYAGNLEIPELAEASRIGIAQKTVSRLKHLERLIQDMLLFARGEALGRETFAVAELVAELAHTFEPLAKTRGVDFSVAAAESESPLTGNRKALAGALTNLIENALQAVDAGKGKVVLALSRSATHWVFAVRDNGRGMAPDVVARLFQPFFTTRTDGTGLGLAIARGVARAHGGGIDVVSAPGAGTEFIMTISLGHEALATEEPCPK